MRLEHFGSRMDVLKLTGFDPPVKVPMRLQHPVGSHWGHAAPLHRQTDRQCRLCPKRGCLATTFIAVQHATNPSSLLHAGADWAAPC